MQQDRQKALQSSLSTFFAAIAMSDEMSSLLFAGEIGRVDTPLI